MHIIYIYLSIYLSICLSLSIYKYIYIYIYIYIHICRYICRYIYIYIYIFLYKKYYQHQLLKYLKYKLRDFWSVTVEMLFIWYPATVVLSNMLGLPLALKKDLEFASDINTDKVRCDMANHLLMFFALLLVNLSTCNYS